MTGRLGRKVYAFAAIIVALSAGLFFWHTQGHSLQPSINFESTKSLLTPTYLSRGLNSRSWNSSTPGNDSFIPLNSTSQGNESSIAAECGRYAQPPGKTCPLNVCCSDAGFCGTTEKFCGETCQSNCVLRPEPKGTKNQKDVRNHVVGFYESWTANRDCHPVDPTSLPVDGLTHVNFAYASIDPDTYEVTTADASTTYDLFKATADIGRLKSDNKYLEVWVSIGGWHFQDDGTATQPLFGEIARDAAKREAFARNVIKFLDQFGFDGVDIEWYPGAADRGGQEDDTTNYVLLAKALRDKVAASPRRLGLSITVPMNYQYLRWFDLPGLLPHIDWMNLKAFDLHGFWNGEEVVDSTVRAHANLTEVKSAAELLWRNDVPPNKVVLGIGLYGRAFQLSDPSCNTPGCTFIGAATPGACTNAAGLLANFEIAGLLNNSEAAIAARDGMVSAYDEGAAINYATFNNDQWVSFENKASIQQKLDWANDTGFLGSMEWPPDDGSLFWMGLNETETGSPDQIGPSLESSQGQIIFGNDIGGELDTGNIRRDWSSLSGQKCYRDDTCVDVDDITIKKCPGAQLMIGWDKAGCKNHHGQKYGKPICCPVDATPSQCTWRGGTDAVGRPMCNGQCHKGEMTLFTSSWGGGFQNEADTNKCTVGEKVFCCKADAFYDEITKDCYYGPCGGGCDVPGTYKVDNVKKHHPNRCTYPVGGSGPQDTDWCCPDPTRFKKCHWVGEGLCQANHCDNDDIQIDISLYGSSHSKCRISRRRALCCDTPQSAPFFNPIRTSFLFPQAPADNDVRYDIQYPKGDKVKDVLLSSGFGMIVLDGPRDKITSAKVKRDGSASDLRFFDCRELSLENLWKANYVCSTSSPGHDCHDLLEGGVQGTIVEMPEDCGTAKYAVVHSLDVAQDQSVPEFLKSVEQDLVVMELTFSYDFRLIKRDGEKVYFRIDYSNAGGEYFTQSPFAMNPVKRSLERRLFSEDPAVLRGVTAKWLQTSAQHEGTIWEEDFNKVLTSSQVVCGNETVYANISLLGSVSAHMKVAMTIIGTIAPEIEIEEMWAVMNVSMKGEMIVDHWQSGRLTIPAHTTELMPSIPRHAFNHSFDGLGMFNVAPTLGLAIAIEGDLEVNANTTSIVSLDTSENIIVGWPPAVADAHGQTAIGSFGKRSSQSNLFMGRVKTAKTLSRLGVDFVVSPSAQVDIVRQFVIPNAYTATIPLRTKLEATVRGFLALQVKQLGTVVADIGATAAGARALSLDGDFGGWDGGGTRKIGNTPPSQQIGVAEAEAPGVMMSPWHSNTALGGALLAAEVAALTCEDTDPDHCELGPYNCKYDICLLNAGYCSDDDSINSEDEGDAIISILDVRSIDERGNSRKLVVTWKDGSTWSVSSMAYPSVGSLFRGDLGQDVLQVYYDYANENDCGNTDIKQITLTGKIPSGYVTEHILELQTIPRFIEAAESGNLWSGARVTPINRKFFERYWNSVALGGNLAPVFRNSPSSSPIPNDRVFEAFGTTASRQNFVATDKEVNGIKAQLWAGRNPRDTGAMSKAVKDWLEKCDSPAHFLKYIKATRAVFSYLNDSEVNSRLWDSVKAVRAQMVLIEKLNGGTGLANIWDKLIADMLTSICGKAKRWTELVIKDALEQIQNFKGSKRNRPDIASVHITLIKLRNKANSITINNIP